MKNKSDMFESYARTLRRVYWAEFIDAQMYGSRHENFRASLLSPVDDENRKSAAPPICLANYFN